MSLGNTEAQAQPTGLGRTSRRWSHWLLVGIAVGLIVWQGAVATKLSKEKKLAEAASKKDRLRAELYIWSSPYPIIVCDEAQTIKLINPAVEQMFGWSRDEMIGQSVDMLLPGDKQEAHSTSMRAAGSKIKAEPGNWMIRAQLTGEGKHRNGRLIPLQLAIRTLKVEGDLEFMAGMREIATLPDKPKVEVKPLPLEPVRNQIQESQKRAEQEIKNAPQNPAK